MFIMLNYLMQGYEERPVGIVMAEHQLDR